MNQLQKQPKIAATLHLTTPPSSQSILYCQDKGQFMVVPSRVNTNLVQTLPPAKVYAPAHNGGHYIICFLIDHSTLHQGRPILMYAQLGMAALVIFGVILQTFSIYCVGRENNHTFSSNFLSIQIRFIRHITFKNHKCKTKIYILVTHYTIIHLGVQYAKDGQKKS